VHTDRLTIKQTATGYWVVEQDGFSSPVDDAQSGRSRVRSARSASPEASGASCERGAVAARCGSASSHAARCGRVADRADRTRLRPLCASSHRRAEPRPARRPSIRSRLFDRQSVRMHDVCGPPSRPAALRRKRVPVADLAVPASTPPYPGAHRANKPLVIARSSQSSNAGALLAANLRSSSARGDNGTSVQGARGSAQPPRAPLREPVDLRQAPARS